MSNTIPLSQAISLQGGDRIEQLPVDQSVPTTNEIQIVNTLFKKHQGTMDLIVEESKDAVLIGALFIVFSLPQINSFINRILPITKKSIYILVLSKAIIFMIFYWLIKHFYLSRKN